MQRYQADWRPVDTLLATFNRIDWSFVLLSDQPFQMHGVRVLHHAGGSVDSLELWVGRPKLSGTQAAQLDSNTNMHKLIALANTVLRDRHRWNVCPA